MRESAEHELDEAYKKIELLEREIERQHGQIDTLTVLTETHSLNEKLHALHSVADELLAQSKSFVPVEIPISDEC
jgi:N-formylglutamate amidohydrolase